MKFLTKKKFKAWLESKSPKTKVGDRCTLGNCPIAKFITQTTGKQCDVDGEYIYVYPDVAKEYACPEWVEKFVDKVDESNPYTISSVSARRALRVLEEC